MPIVKTVKGDLLELFRKGEFDAIVHGCNCHHAMRSGIAAQVTKEFPQAPEADIIYTDWGDENKLGSASMVQTAFGVIVNLYTQYHPGREKPENLYANIRKGFTYLNTLDYELPNLGIPLIGAGIAGGDWDIIKEIINEVTPNLNITVVEFER